jgi:AcrR family transcriptional regulator
VAGAVTPRRTRARRGQGEQLHADILTAAKTLLARTGKEEAVSIRAVADLVGVTPPSIYLHFPSKEALLDAVCAEVFMDLHAAMVKAAATAHSPLAKLRAQGLAYVRFALDRPEHYRLATMSVRQGATDVDAVLTSGAFTHLRESIQACMDAGVLRPGDPVPVALGLWSATHGIASLVIAKPYLPWGDIESFADTVLLSAMLGRAVADRLRPPVEPTALTAWLQTLDRP